MKPNFELKIDHKGGERWYKGGKQAKWDSVPVKDRDRLRNKLNKGEVYKGI